MQYREITSYSLDDSKNDITVSYTTDNTCVRCGIGVERLEVQSFYTYNRSSYYIYFVEYCPVCNKVALREIQTDSEKFYGNSIGIRQLWGYRYPNNSENHIFTHNICELSPRFVDIYHQSEDAENAGLTEVCGMGYRKSLEFLIKDFLIHQEHEQKEQVPTITLSAAINLLENKSLKTLALRCAWLGNDESHYVRKHENYSVSDLKTFILAAVAYVDSELCLEKAAAIAPVRQ